MNRIIVLLLLAISFQSYAFNQSPTMFRGIRPLGMGNAFIAVSDDENALFYNPAGLNDVERVRIEIVNPTFEISFNVVDIIQTVIDLNDEFNKGGSSSAADAIDDVADKHLGEVTSLRVALAPGVVLKNFGLKVFANTRGHFAIRNRVFPNLEYNANGDVGMALGGAYGLFDKLIQFGVTAKPHYRLDTGTKSLGLHNSEEFRDELSDFNRGLGMDIDVGFKTHLEVLANMLEIPHVTPLFNYLRPRGGFVVQNIPILAPGDAEDDPLTLSAGGAFSFDFWKFKNTFALDIRDINRASHPLNKLAIGLESIWDLSKYFIPSARLGLYQGRPTGGLALDFLRIWRGEIAMYSEEIGEQDRIKGDLRVALSLTLLGWY